MMYGLKAVVRYALGKDIAGRSLAVRRDDTMLVSYPRSGNTWTRFLIANLLYPERNITFANIESMIPDAEAQSSRYLKGIPSPRVIKSHQYFDHRYPRVIYIVRDPRDVVLSYYDFARKYRQIADDLPREQFVTAFVAGALTSISWGTWAQNVGTWLAARGGTSDFLLLRYEDLLAQPEQELRRVVHFFGIPADEERCRRAISLSSADRMRESEKKHANEWISTRDKRADIPFVGTAAAGKWKSKLTAPETNTIESAWGDLMKQLGYQLGGLSDGILPPRLQETSLQPTSSDSGRGTR